MSPWIEAAFAKYGWIFGGIVIGFAAKYGLRLKSGQRIKARHVIGDVLLTGAVALISWNAATNIGLKDEAAAVLACFVTVGADRIIRIMTERWLRQLEAATLRSVAEELADADGNLKQAMQKADSARRGATEGFNAPTWAKTAARRAKLDEEEPTK